MTLRQSRKRLRPLWPGPFLLRPGLLLRPRSGLFRLKPGLRLRRLPRLNPSRRLRRPSSRLRPPSLRLPGPPTSSSPRVSSRGAARIRLPSKPARIALIPVTWDARTCGRP